MPHENQHTLFSHSPLPHKTPTFLPLTLQAKAAVTTGVVASVIIGVVLAAIFISTSCCCPPKVPYSSKMAEWRPNAEKAFTPLAVGAFFQSLGLITGFAAPAIPWMSVGATASIPYFSAGANVIFTAMLITAEASFTAGGTITITYSVVNPLGIAGAVIAYVSVIFLIMHRLLIRSVQRVINFLTKITMSRRTPNADRTGGF